jgi:hypothetical protein
MWNPLSATIAVFNNAGTFIQKPLTWLADGSVLTARSSTAKLNVTATGQMKTGAGRLVAILVQTAPTSSGALTFNDMLSSGTPAAANQLYSIPYNATQMVAGAIINVDAPFTTGLNISAVGGGSPVYTLLYN